MKPWRPRTFPEDWMPLMTARQTKIQATSRERTIFQFRPPVSSMLLVMLRVWRYQKYVVAELFSHSGTTTTTAMMIRRELALTVLRQWRYIKYTMDSMENT